jgi:hypothetical protein
MVAGGKLFRICDPRPRTSDYFPELPDYPHNELSRWLFAKQDKPVAQYLF